MRKLLLPLAAVLFSLTALASGKPAPFRLVSAVPIQFDLDANLTLPLYNECTGEWIDMEVRHRISIRGAINGRQVHSVYQTSANYLGTGQTTGWRYAGHSQENGSAGGPITSEALIMHIVDQTVVAAPGGGNNYKVKHRYTLRIAPDGTVTKESESTEVSCQ